MVRVENWKLLELLGNLIGQGWHTVPMVKVLVVMRNVAVLVLEDGVLILGKIKHVFWKGQYGCNVR